jgi:hypothetical protein
MSSAMAYVAEFSQADALVAAARSMTAAGYRALDAYTPYPVSGLEEALDVPSSKLPWWALAGAVSGGSLGYFMLWYSSAIDYPLNVGGRPLHSWPAYIPITFELSVLGTAIAVVLGVVFTCRLTRLHQPVFSLPGFQLASPARFYLLVPLADGKGDERVRSDLERLEPQVIHELARE